MSSLSTALFIAGAAIGGAALALLPAMLYFRGQIDRLAGRVDQTERAKQQANQHLLEARAQLESLQQELAEARRQNIVQAAGASARAAAAAAEADAARQRAKAELLRQLEANDKKAPAASGFADTQPMSASNFGALARG